MSQRRTPTEIAAQWERIWTNINQARWLMAEVDARQPDARIIAFPDRTEGRRLTQLGEETLEEIMADVRRLDGLIAANLETSDPNTVVVDFMDLARRRRADS